MVSLATTFSIQQVKDFLVADGYTPGTPEFRHEMDRRFVPISDDVFEERDDWDGDRRQAPKT